MIDQRHPRLKANLSSSILVEEAVRRGEGLLTVSGAFMALTGSRTGRSPKDKFIVRDHHSEHQVDWSLNQPMSPEAFNRLRDRILAYLQNRDLYSFDGYACADRSHQLPLRVITERAWHALFARCLFRRLDPHELSGFTATWTVLNASDFRCDPTIDGSRSDAVIAVSFDQKLVLIAGTQYAGEIKKSIFTVLNGLLPQAGVLSMHCSANIGKNGDTALFFGLSGTGKTTLSADPDRRLIGDDEHGWSSNGVFNIEGGCYAKTIRLSPEGEPQIWNALSFGSVLENVPVDPTTRIPDFNSSIYTENTRAAYPVEHIPNCELSGMGSHPTNVFFLTFDAFGVLPPLSRLSPEMALQQFLLGYTAKVAGTEAGVTEPTPEFSTCFSKPFLPLPPKRYAMMLKERLERHRVPVWLVNTGWTGGPYGIGRRMKLEHTRSLLAAVFRGDLQHVDYSTIANFGFEVPSRCPGVPSEILLPRNTWPDPAAYDEKAAELAQLFREKLKSYE